MIEVKRKTDAETKSFQLGFGQFIVTRPYATLRGLDSQKQDTVDQGRPVGEHLRFRGGTPEGAGRVRARRGPRAEVIVRDKSNTIDYIFGAEKGTQTWFAIRGQPGVYLTDTSSLDFLKTKPFDVIDKFTFIPNIDDVDRMDISAGGKTHTPGHHADDEEGGEGGRSGRGDRRLHGGRKERGGRQLQEVLPGGHRPAGGGRDGEEGARHPRGEREVLPEQGGRENRRAWTTPPTTATSTRSSSTGSASSR